ncbi:hypothetical protein [Cyanobium sp. ATX 6F1]|uniref:hypothetical protein n=1 Tax=unclassified Cyanobium TaxID=2627006 RepID=UPI0020CD2DA3|nr:hypothetical protein [Cyanobium sp. ATX 6F1]MCP9916707.1 hypothetical protein [Cyanobium sp. ATX 6F1]
MRRKPTEDFLLFLFGGALFAAGIVLFTSQVMVGSQGSLGLGGWFGRGSAGRGGSFFGGLMGFDNGQGFGLLMVPLAIGAALLLAGTYRKLAWLLIGATSAALGVLVLQSLVFSFRPTSLWSLLAMVAMVGGGAGLMFRSLRQYPDQERERNRSDLDDLRSELDRLRRQLDDGPEGPGQQD